jgi:hypothetical protein
MLASAARFLRRVAARVPFCTGPDLWAGTGFVF